MTAITNFELLREQQQSLYENEQQQAQYHQREQLYHQDKPIPKPRKSLLNRTDDKALNSLNHSMNNNNSDKSAISQTPYTKAFSPPPIEKLVCDASTSVATCNLLFSDSSSPTSPPPNIPLPPCPVRVPPISLPPPLPPRNVATRSSLLPLGNDEMHSASGSNHAECTSESSSSTSTRNPQTVDLLNTCLSSLPSLSSDCSTSYSSTNSADVGEHFTFEHKFSLDIADDCDFVEQRKYQTRIDCLNSASIMNSGCKSVGESVCFSGWIRLISLPHGVSMKKETDGKRRCWAVIRQNQFSFMKNDETSTSFLGPFDLCRCIFAGRDSQKHEEISVIFRDVTVFSNGGKNSLYNCIKFVPEDNADYWLIFLAKCYSPQIDVVQNALASVDVCGKLWIRQGISGTWTEGWANVHQRELTFWLLGANSLLTSDIRKMILVKRDVPIADYCNFIENSVGGPILIALDGCSLYLQAESDACTDLWHTFIGAELRNNGVTLEENRLTADNVPVIVDKCLRLVATYGLHQPGIYRRNGSAAQTRKLLAQFRDDPFNVQMESISDENINAIADVLRSFFRQLQKPLVPENVHRPLFQIVENSAMSEAERVVAYQSVIFSLPKVYFATLKRLLAHLQQITFHSNKNLATVENIAKIFGPTIFTVDKKDEEISVDTYSKAATTVRDLLLRFDSIFQIPEEEINAKSKLDELQEQKPKARAEGFLVPIHLFEKDNKCFNVQCEWSAMQAVTFRVERLLVASDASLADTYALFEVVKDGQLERRISGDESLKSIALGRWLEWQNTVTDCYLLLKRNTILFQPQNIRPFADNIKFAEPGSKSFKTCQLRIECGTKVVQYSKSMRHQNEWIVDEMLWFVGHETDRKPSYPYTLTFFTSSTKYATRFAGYCVAFKDEVQRDQWLNAVIVCRQEYLPMPIVQI